jgi:hypothetical protein
MEMKGEGEEKKATGKCIPCFAGQGGCTKCNTANTECETCGDGHYLDAESKKCKVCATNCAKCTGANTCTECKGSY